MAPLEGKPMTRERRAKIYFRLMDIVLVLSAIGFAEFLLDKVGDIILIQKSSPIYAPVSIFFLTMNFVVPLFLILARFMRDEYAEQLWKRTAVVMSYLLATLPAAILAGAWLAYLAPATLRTLPQFMMLFDPAPLYVVTTATWMIGMLLFVAVFQFLRWRDAR
jgi:hypothetical protein